MMQKPRFRYDNDPRAAPLVSPRLLGSGGSVCSVSDQLKQLAANKALENVRKSCCEAFAALVQRPVANRAIRRHRAAVRAYWWLAH